MTSVQMIKIILMNDINMEYNNNHDDIQKIDKDTMNNNKYDKDDNKIKYNPTILLLLLIFLLLLVLLLLSPP